MIIFLAIIVFFFTLFVLSKDDFVLLRKNVTQITLFDFACIAGIVGLFFARLIFVVSHFSPLYLNVLVFFAVPYFPGLSLAGLLLGGLSTLYLLFVRKKMPIGRIFDIYSFALVATMIVVYMGMAVAAIFWHGYVLGSTYGILAILMWAIYLMLHVYFIKSAWKDGTLALWNFAVIAVASFVGQEATVHFRSFIGDSLYFALFLVLLFVSLFLRKFRKMGVGL